MGGATTKPRTVRHDAEGRIVRYEAPADGALAGVWVEVRALTTGGQLRALLSRTYFADFFDWAAPRLVAWCVTGERVVETVLPAGNGLPERTVTDTEPADVPAPAEVGPQAFLSVVVPGGDATVLWRWVYACLVASATHRDGPEAPDAPPVPEPPEEGEPAGGKASSGRSGTTPAGTPTGSDAAPPTKRSRRSRGS